VLHQHPSSGERVHSLRERDTSAPLDNI
jgi:hypothetical protein